MANTFAGMVAELAGTYCHAAGDTVAVARCLEQALYALRSRRVEWGEGRTSFVTEPGVSTYPFGDYPRLPGDITYGSTEMMVGNSQLAGTVLRPDTLVSSTNLQLDGGGAATIAALQDSAQEPDDVDLHPASAANTAIVVRWDVAMARPLDPGTEGSAALGKQIMPVSMYNEGTDREVEWTVKEATTTIDSGTWTVNSSSRTVYEARWDAAKLSTRSPAANQITLVLEDKTSAGEVHFAAVQWFTGTRTETVESNLSMTQVQIVHLQRIRDLEEGWWNIPTYPGSPFAVASFNDRFIFYPVPNGSYPATLDYQKDSTRDETTGAKITADSTTETNAWFREGWMELAARTMELYFAIRPHNVKAASLAKLVASDAERSQSKAYHQALLQAPPQGYL